MKKFFLLIIIIFISSCAIANKNEQRQDIVSQEEIELMSYIREGMYYFKQSKFWDAVSSFEKASMIKKSSNIQYNLALAYERLGDNDKALSIMLTLYQEYPYDINYKMAYARMLDLMGSRENAISIYLESLAFLNEINDTKGYKYKIYRRLSDLYFKMGEEDEATCYAKMALDARNTVDETLRYNRFLLSVDRQEDFIRNFESKPKPQNNLQDGRLFHEELEISQYNNEEQDYGDGNEISADSEMLMQDQDSELLNSSDPKVNECKFQNVFAWDLFYNIKQNNQKIVQVVDMSSQCLSNKDVYYPVFLVMKQIIKEYQKSLYGNTQQKNGFFDIFSDDEEEESISISDSTYLDLPGIAYPYLFYFFKNYGIAKNGSIE